MQRIDDAPWRSRSSKRQVYRKGHNNYRTYSSDNILDPAEVTCHAECDVLHKLLKIRNLRRNNITMYIVRIGQSGELRESAPCHHCHEKMLFLELRLLFIPKKFDHPIIRIRRKVELQTKQIKT